MSTPDAEIHLCCPDIPKTTSLSDALAALRATQRQELAFFDSTLSGFVHVIKLPTETVSNITATFTVAGSEGRCAQIVSMPLLPLLEDDEGALYKFSAHIPFPKSKFDEPIVELQVQGMLSANIGNVKKETVTQFARSGFPVDRRNVLSGLAPLGGHSKSVLLDTLIKDNKLDPVSISETPPPSEEPQRATTPQQELKLSVSVPIIRLLNLRIRNVRISKSSVLSTIDIESSSKAKDLGIITTLDGILHGFQRTTHPKFTQRFPIEVSEDDSYSFTFLLESHEAINFKSLITVNYSCDSHAVVTKLLTNIDFMSPFPSKLQQPKNLSSPNLNNVNSTGPSSLSNALVVRFIGSKSVKLGEPFKLTLQVHNITRKPRNLVMVFNGDNDGYVPQLPKIKSLVLPFSTVLRNYATSRLRSVGLVSLDNEVHLKADAGAVFETEIQLMGLETGITPLQGATITDISTGESMSCDKMLEIIVQ